jgi:hypothetical protein
MGNCGSSPAVEDSGACDSAERDAAALKPALKKGAPCVTSAEARRSPPSAMSSVGGRSVRINSVVSAHSPMARPAALVERILSATSSLGSRSSSVQLEIIPKARGRRRGEHGLPSAA